MEWQPIETAPKDVKEVLVYDPTEHPTVFTARYIYGWERSSADICALNDDYFGDPHVHPTHWMPLPEPPKESE